MMKLTNRLTAAALTFVMGTGALIMPAVARASEEGRRNTAIGLGAAAAYLLLKERNKTAGIIAGAGAALAYKRYNDSINDRHKRERYGYYDRYDRYDNRYDDRYYDNRYDRERRDQYDRDNRDRYDSRYDDRYDSRRDRDDRYYYKTRRK